MFSVFRTKAGILTLTLTQSILFIISWNFEWHLFALHFMCWHFYLVKFGRVSLVVQWTSPRHVLYVDVVILQRNPFWYKTFFQMYPAIRTNDTELAMLEFQMQPSRPEPVHKKHLRHMVYIHLGTSLTFPHAPNTAFFFFFHEFHVEVYYFIMQLLPKLNFDLSPYFSRVRKFVRVIIGDVCGQSWGEREREFHNHTHLWRWGRQNFFLLHKGWIIRFISTGFKICTHFTFAISNLD